MVISRPSWEHGKTKRVAEDEIPSKETGLLEELERGDPAAWKAVHQKYAAAVFRWAVLLGLRSADAEEVAQEVFLIASRKVGQCRSEEGLKPWLFRITRHVAANARRKVWLKRGILKEEAPEPAFEWNEDSGREQELAVRGCLHALSAKHREVLILADVEGHTRDEVAEALGIPPGTVASRLRLARRAFRERWDETWSETKDTKR